VLRARVHEGVGELRAAAIVGGRAAGHVADIHAPPLGKLQERRARAKGARLASLLWGSEGICDSWHGSRLGVTWGSS
jgi:hypothetical protein